MRKKKEQWCKHKGINKFGRKCTGYVCYSYGELCSKCYVELAKEHEKAHKKHCVEVQASGEPCSYCYLCPLAKGKA